MWWKTRLTKEEAKDILKDLFANFPPQEYWMIIWLERAYALPDGNIVIDAALAQIFEYELTQFTNSKLGLRQLRTIGIPIQLLPLVGPGMIFRDGIIRFELHKAYLNSFKVGIDVDTATPITLESWKLGQQFRKALGLDKTDFRYGTEKRGSFGLKSRIFVFENTNPNLDADYIVYPSHEVARFYLFPSSKITLGVIAPRLISKTKDNVFYVPESLKEPTEQVQFHFLRLRNEMNTRDAWVIARIAFSVEMRKAIAEVRKSFVNNSRFGGANWLYLDTIFPFRGEASQDVYGIIIYIEGKKILLVLEINECYKMFPYTSLRWARESDRKEIDTLLPLDPKEKDWEFDKNEGEDDDTSPEERIEYIYNPSFDNDATRNNSVRNERKIRNAELTVHRKRFPNLTFDIQRLDVVKTAPVGLPKKIIITPTSNLSQNQNKADDTKSAGLDIVSNEQNNRINLGNYADLLRMIVSELIEMGCKVTYHNGSDSGQGEFCYLFINVSHLELTSDQAAFSTMPDGKERRIVAISIEYNGRYFTLLEFEPRGQNSYKVFYKNDFVSPLTWNEDIRLILDEAVKSLGSMQNLPKNYVYERLNHRKTSPKAHAKRILSILYKSQELG